METIIPNKSRGWKNIIYLILPYIFIVGICEMTGFYFAGIDITNYKPIQETTKQLFIITFFGMVGTFLVVCLFRKYVDKKTFISLGFEKDNRTKDILLGLAVGFIIMLSGFISLILAQQIEFSRIIFLPVDFLLSIGIFIFVALSESLLMRGYVLNSLMTSFNKYVALIISSIIFSLMHARNENYGLFSMVDLFIAGLLLGLGYIYTRNLWFPIALHFSWNFFQGTIFGFKVSGKDTYSLIVTKEYGSNLWNGGGFGFEGSVFSMLFQIFAIAVVFLIFRNRLPPANYEMTTNKAMDRSTG